MQANLPFRQGYRQNSRQQSRQLSIDPHNEIRVHQEHYIGIDVGTGSARACIINVKGDIVGVASENIGMWQPEVGYYVSQQCLPLLACTLPLTCTGTIHHRHLELYLQNSPTCHVPAPG